MKAQTTQEINSTLNQIKHNETIRKDIVIESGTMKLNERANELYVGGDSFKPTSVFHEQLADFLEIPERYYSKLKNSDPGLLAHNVNYLIEQRRFDDDTRMLRTIGEKAIALRSERYQKRDNGELLNVVSSLIDDDNVKISRLDVTDKRFYINLLFPKLQAEVRVGDIVQYGIHASNSETGYGTLKTAYMSYRLWCLNGAMRMSSEFVMKHKHLGKVKGLGVVHEDRWEQLQQGKFWKEFQNKFHTMIENTPQVFNKEVNLLKELAARKIEGQTDEVVTKLGRVLELRQAEVETMFGHLLVSEDFTHYGLLQAVTRSAQDAKDYDRSVELEHLAEKVINLTPSQWHMINV